MRSTSLRASSGDAEVLDERFFFRKRRETLFERRLPADGRRVRNADEVLVTKGFVRPNAPFSTDSASAAAAMSDVIGGRRPMNVRRRFDFKEC